MSWLLPHRVPVLLIRNVRQLLGLSAIPVREGHTNAEAGSHASYGTYNIPLARRAAFPFQIPLGTVQNPASMGTLRNIDAGRHCKVGTH